MDQNFLKNCKPKHFNFLFVSLMCLVVVCLQSLSGQTVLVCSSFGAKASGSLSSFLKVHFLHFDGSNKLKQTVGPPTALPVLPLHQK